MAVQFQKQLFAELRDVYFDHRNLSSLVLVNLLIGGLLVGEPVRR